MFHKSRMLPIALAQLNLTVGDIEGNATRIIDTAETAREKGCRLVVFPELSVTGYPPEDLLLRRDFIDTVDREMQRIVRSVAGIAMIVGHPHRFEGGLYNAASFVLDGFVVSTYCKQHLPNYSVFDEKRYFRAGRKPCVIDFSGTRIGPHHL